MNLRDLIREAERQGFRVSLHGSHYHAVPPDKRKRMVVFSLNTGSWRAIKNVLADLRRAGLRWSTHTQQQHNNNNNNNNKEEKMNPAAIDRYIKDHAEEIPLAPPSPSPGAVAAGDALERCFTELKDARVLVAMADEEWAQALKDLKEAEARRDAAGKAVTAARADFRQAKERFDAECNL